MDNELQRAAKTFRSEPHHIERHRRHGKRGRTPLPCVIRILETRSTSYGLRRRRVCLTHRAKWTDKTNPQGKKVKGA